VGRTAAALPWLCPNTDSLIRLAEAPATLARPCGADPALLAFLIRFTPPALPPLTGFFCPSSLAGSSLPDAAGAFLAASRDGWIPPSEVSKRCRALTNAASSFARRLAEHTRRADPDRAFAVASLAPLGWLAVSAVDANSATEQLPNSNMLPIPAQQAEAWGLDQNAIARRLANRWRLPEWIASALGNLNLPLFTAKTLVADIGLFAVVQLALVEAERRSQSLAISHGADRGALLKELAIKDAVIEELWAASATPQEESQSLSVLEANPHKVPLIANLLKMAGESRRRNGASLVARLEDRLDELHRGVAQVGSDAETRARDAKLTALAELAAGAGHEINTPLAIISGNAQRLYRTEPEPERGESLQKIIRQTERIAGIIRDLMQFARPSRPKPHRCAAAELLQAVRDDLSEFAAEKGVQVELTCVPASEFIRCDYSQLKHTLLAVVKNGIEAAGRDGWVRFGCVEGDEEFVRFAVEDSGPGLSAAVREHAFDPFFCGRSAGRGRGLGLPTAWQFARQNGGELRYEATTDGPTRFVLVVPRSITLEFLDRQSA
jgi:signal transduction histidine kinase